MMTGDNNVTYRSDGAVNVTGHWAYLYAAPTGAISRFAA
jgi:hypothetical protein